MTDSEGVTLPWRYSWSETKQKKVKIDVTGRGTDLTPSGVTFTLLIDFPRFGVPGRKPLEEDPGSRCKCRRPCPTRTPTGPGVS